MHGQLPLTLALTRLVLSCAEQEDSISISGMKTPSHLAGQKMKSRWPPMEGNFLRQFQSPFAVLYVRSSPLHDFSY